MADITPQLNPQPLPPGREEALNSPPWWPELLWQLHFPIGKHPGPGPGPVNYPPAIDNIMAGLHIHTMSYLMLDQAAGQQIRQITEQRLAYAVQNLSKSHDDAMKADKTKSMP